LLLQYAAGQAAPASPRQACSPARPGVSGSGSSIGPQRNVACTFTPAGPGPVEYYTGKISKLGGDIGVTTGGGVAVWLWCGLRPIGRSVPTADACY
jgi:hypothetical protein